MHFGLISSLALLLLLVSLVSLSLLIFFQYFFTKLTLEPVEKSVLFSERLDSRIIALVKAYDNVMPEFSAQIRSKIFLVD